MDLKVAPMTAEVAFDNRIASVSITAIQEAINAQFAKSKAFQRGNTKLIARGFLEASVSNGQVINLSIALDNPLVGNPSLGIERSRGFACPTPPSKVTDDVEQPEPHQPTRPAKNLG